MVGEYATVPAALERLPDWRHRLSRALNVRMNRPFDAVENSCVTLMNGAVEALVGVTPRQVTWRNIADVAERLNGPGGYEAHFGIDHLFGPPSGDWRRLRFGDIARLPAHLGVSWRVETYAVAVDGGRMLLAPGDKGLQLMPASMACKVWHIG